MIGESNPWGPLNVESAEGIPLNNYNVDFGEAGFLDFTASMAIFWLRFFWDLYQFVVAVTVWIYQSTIEMQMMSILLTPAVAAVNALAGLITHTGVQILFGSIAGLISAVWMIRGRYAQATGNIIFALIMMALLGVIGNPVQTLSGNDGYTSQAQQIGMELSSEIIGRDLGSTKEEQTRSTSGELVSVMMQPIEIINFGQPLSPECRAVHRAALRQGSTETGALSERMADCNAEYGEWMENPQTEVVLLAMMISLSGLVGAALMVYFGIQMLAAQISLLIEGVKSVWAITKAILPGEARSDSSRTFAKIFFNLSFIAGLIIVMNIWAESLRYVSVQAEHPMAGALTQALLAVMAMVAIGKMRKRGRHAALTYGTFIGDVGSPNPTAASNQPEARLAAMVAAGYVARSGAGRARSVLKASTAGFVGGKVAKSKIGTISGAKQAVEGKKPPRNDPPSSISRSPRPPDNGGSGGGGTKVPPRRPTPRGPAGGAAVTPVPAQKVRVNA